MSSPPASSRADEAPPEAPLALRRALLAAVALGLLAQLQGAFLLNVNWDEFHYLGFVHEFLRGELAHRWTTFGVHAYSWVAAVPGHELAQVTAGRLAAWLQVVATAGFTYAIARRFLGVTASLYSVLAYVWLGYALAHAASFRPDPTNTLLFVAALHLWLPPARGAVRAALAGLLLGLSAVFSLKAMIHVAAFALVALALAAARRFREGEPARLLAGGAAAAVSALALHAWHVATLPAQPLAEQAPGSLLPWLGSRMLWTGHLFPARHYLLQSLREDPVTWATILLGGVLCLVRLARGRRDAAAWLPLLIALPLGSLAVYRNGFPYFYPTVLTPAVVLGGLAFEALWRRARERGSRVLALVAGLIPATVLLQGLSHQAANLADQQASQREHLELVHAAFPEPVPYIDRCSMVSSYPKVGFFMSSLGIRLYHERGEPVLSRLLRERQPRFLLANVDPLRLAWPTSRPTEGRLRLLPEDDRALRRHYIHHWGLLYVPGKLLHEAAASGATSFEILIAGPYTLEAPAPIRLNGVELAPGEVVHLPAGRHSFALPAGRPAVLRWGEHLVRPEQPPLVQPIFTGF